MNPGIVCDLPRGLYPLPQTTGEDSPVGTSVGVGAAGFCLFLAYHIRMPMPIAMINTMAAAAQMPPMAPPDRLADDVVVAAAVLLVAEAAGDDEMVVDGAIPPGRRNWALSSASPLSLAGRRSVGGHSPVAQGSLAQHPTKGGLLNLHVYQILMLAASSQSCLGRSTYLSPEKEAARRFALGHFPLDSGVQGLVVQQPTNSVLLLSQM